MLNLFKRDELTPPPTLPNAELVEVLTMVRAIEVRLRRMETRLCRMAEEMQINIDHRKDDWK